VRIRAGWRAADPVSVGGGADQLLPRREPLAHNGPVSRG